MWRYPKLKISAPEGAVTDGFPELPEGMLAWTNKNNKYTVLVCGYMADPELRTEAAWNSLTEGMLPHEIDTEYLISFASRGGMKVFPWIEDRPEKFSRSHTDYRDGAHWKIPSNWHLIAGMDYGGTINPTSCHIYAIDEKKNWHAVWEFYQPAHFREVSEALLKHPLYPRLTKICLDKTAYKNDQQDQNRIGVFRSVAELMMEAGISILEPSNSDRLAGLARVLDIFNQRPGEDRPSRFFISDDCPMIWDELAKMVYRQETEAQLLHRNPAEDVEKKDDHAYDEFRYALMGWDSEAEIDPWRPDDPLALVNIEAEIDEMYEMEKRGGLFN